MSQWTLFNPPPFRSKDNTRPGHLAEDSIFDTTVPTLTTKEITKKNQNQPPLFLLVTRASPTTVELVHALSNEVLYKIHDTGRGTFSSKPDYEIFRSSAGDLLVGSIRYGKRNIEARMSVTGTKVDDVEKFTSTTSQNNLKWRTTYFGRKKSVDKTSPNASQTYHVPKWITEVECFNSDMPVDDEQNKVAAVRLYDGFPNGRIEIWDKNACVDIGGDWNILDELVIVSYGNMEKARRKVMGTPDPTGVGIAGLGMGLGGFGGGVGGF